MLGAATYTDDFGDPRGQGGHEGNDIMAPKRALALAVEAGTVKFWTTSSRAGCMLYLYGESGTEYLYVHLNNDLTHENDNQGQCVPGVAFAKGLKSGAKVLAGEPIGFVGDSGDADGIHPHLHFEVHPSGGGAVSPYPYLRKARQLLFAARPGRPSRSRSPAHRSPRPARMSRSRLDQVRSWPGGRRVKQTGLKVAVSIPETASIEGMTGPPAAARVHRARAADQGLAGDDLDGAREGDARRTVRRRRARSSASRVVVKPEGLGGFGEISAEPPGRAARPEAASSSRTDRNHYQGRSLTTLPRNEHRTPATSGIAPDPPRPGSSPSGSRRSRSSARRA